MKLVKGIIATTLALSFVATSAVSATNKITGDYNGDGNQDAFNQAINKGETSSLTAEAGSTISTFHKSWTAAHPDISQITDWSAENYGAFKANLNASPGDELLLLGKKKIILLHGDIITPILLPKDVQNAIISWSSSGVASYTSFEMDADPNQFNVLFGDFNGDGYQEIMLQGKSVGSTAYILNNDGSISQTLANGYQGMDWSGASYTMVIQDINGDGIDDLQATSNIAGQDNRLIYMSDAKVDYYDVIYSSIGGPAAAFSPGVTSGEFRVSESGAATYSIPINLPAGTAGVTPQISLGYSSQGGDGMMGIGWSLSTGSAISRCPKTIAQDGVISGVDFSSNDRFCLDGQRLMNTSGTHGRDGAIYYTELDSFSKIEAHGNATETGPLGFTVETKAGEVRYYGYVDAVTGSNAISLFDYWNNSEIGQDTFIEPKGHATKNLAQSYLLKAIKDVSGNYILFEYLESNGSANIDRVSYTGNANSGQTPYAYAQMNYSTKAVMARRGGYVAGSAAIQDKILNSINVKLNDQIVHHYALDYFVPTLAEENYTLESIQECSDSAKSDCYPATTFNWHKPVPSSQTTQEFCEYEPGVPEFCYDLTTNSDFNPFGNQSTKLADAYNVGTNQVFDMNGDGYSDIVYTDGGYYKIALGPTFTTRKNLTTIGDDKSQYLLNLDYDGDGKRDLLVANTATSNWNIVSFENYTTQQQICEPLPPGGGQIPFGGELCEWVTINHDIKVQSIGRTAIGLEGKAQILDIDGNGLEDIVYQSGSKIYWYKNNGGTFSAGAELLSFTSSNSGTSINTPIHRYTANMKNASGIDINGDGRSDLIIKVTDTISTCTVNGQVYGFVASRGECENDIGGTWFTSTTTGYKLYTSNGSALNKAQDLGNHEDVRVADINGDGLTDLLQYSSASQWSYRLSDGRSLLPGVTLPNGSTSDTYKNQSYFIDLNGDGAVEFLKATSSTNWNIYISQYASDSSVLMTYRGNITRTSDAAYQFGDVDGDGKLDLLQGKTGSHGWKVSYAPRSGKPDYVIKDFTNGFGVSTEVFYRPMTDTNVYIFSDSDANVDSKTFSPMSGMALVSRAESDTTASDRVSLNYQYGGFLVHREGRGMLGFEEVRTIDNQSLIETETIFKQIFPHIGMPLATRQLLTDGRIIGDATNTLATSTTINGQKFPYIQSSSEKSWSVGSDNVLYEINRTNSSFTYDTYGNLINSTVTGSDHYGNNDVETKTVNTFGGTWEKRMGRLRTSTATKKRDAISQIRKIDFTYYAETHATSPGLLKTSELWPDSTNQSLLTSYEYDSFGNKSKVTKTGDENNDGSNTNIQNRISQSVFGNNGRLLDYTIYSAGITTSYLYNGYSASSGLGRITEVTTTVNGIASTNVMDSWGRTIESTSPGGSNIITEYDFCSVVSCDSSGGYYRVRTTKVGAPEKRVYFDTFGREIESRVKNFLNSWTAVRRQYDSQGRESKTFEPSAAASTYYTQPTYDTYGRVIQVKQPDNTSVYSSFYGLKTQSIDARGNVDYRWKNEQGELAKAEDAEGNTLEYIYDSYGNLLNVLMTTSNNQTSTKVTNIFDDYGHKIQTYDTDKGAWTYQFNAFNEVVKLTTARGQSSVLDYDVAGRLVRRYENEGTSCWNYNGTTGRLSNEKTFNNVNKTIEQCVSDNTENNKKTYLYDNHGRVYQTDVTIQNVNANVDGIYMTTTSFDQYGRIREVMYPNELAIENVYTNGYLDQIKNSETGRVYQNINSMNVYGQVLSVSYANGAEESIGYQASNGRVSSHRLSKDGDKHQLNYQYDNNGNIGYRRHQFMDKGFTDWNETLTYDNLNRLDYRNASITDNSYLTSGFQSDQDYNYDDWGNLTFKYGVGNYTYDSTKKNRLLSTSGTINYSMDYDANGNITSDGTGRAFSYFSFDKVNRITKGATYSEFLYGSNRARYYRHDIRTENNQTADYYTAYVGAYEKIHRSGGGKATLTEHKVNIGNIVITTRSDGTDAENYLHKDHLGSTISVTDKVGNIVQQFTYDPWGKQTRIYQESSFADLTFNQPTNRGYTGHEHIRDLDIIHMNGRIYDANIGRFMQADPNIQAAGNFQNYNRYSYVLNNPLSLTDPRGFFFKKLFKAVKKYWKQIVSIALTVIAGPLGTFIGNYLMTGSLRGALIGAVAGAIGIGLGGLDGFHGFLANGAIGGMMSKLQGGNFGRGFMSAGMGNALGGMMKGVKNYWGKMLTSAVIGGTVSRLSGGKFANGAVSSAFSFAVTQAYGEWKNDTGTLYEVNEDAKGNLKYKKIANPDEAVIENLFINGQSNDIELAVANGHTQLGGASRFHVYYNPTHGGLSDTLESLFGKLLGPSNVAKNLSGVLAGNAGSLKMVAAHSQGTIILSNALELIPNTLTQNTTISFFGPAASKAWTQDAVTGAGASYGQWKSHNLDFVGNVIGGGANNFGHWLGNVIAFPLLFTDHSQHSTYYPN